MPLENRFIFLAKVFLLTFLIINLVNFFPINLSNVFYYTNIFNVLLDTTSLLLLGLAISRFLIIRRIETSLKIKSKNPEENKSIDKEIDKFEKKDSLNYKLLQFCLAFFIIIFISQPITLLFILNRNDLYINNTINSLSKSLDIKKNEILSMDKKPFNKELDQDSIKQKNEQKEEIIMNLVNQHDLTIDNLIKRNNIQKLNQIKFIIRNLFLSLVWAFGFFKLSKIHYQE